MEKEEKTIKIIKHETGYSIYKGNIRIYSFKWVGKEINGLYPFANDMGSIGFLNKYGEVVGYYPKKIRKSLTPKKEIVDKSSNDDNSEQLFTVKPSIFVNDELKHTFDWIGKRIFNLFPFIQNNKLGFINNKGEIVIEAIYDVEYEEKDLNNVRKINIRVSGPHKIGRYLLLSLDNKQGLVDPLTGKPVTEFIFDYIYEFANERALVVIDDKKGHIDTEGNIINAAEYNYLEAYEQEGFASFRKESYRESLFDEDKSENGLLNKQGVVFLYTAVTPYYFSVYEAYRINNELIKLFNLDDNHVILIRDNDVFSLDPSCTYFYENGNIYLMSDNKSKDTPSQPGTNLAKKIESISYPY